MNERKERAELHCHTNMSIMDGTASVQDIIQFAHDNGMPAIAITDTEKIFAYPDAAKTLAQINDPNFKVIYGVEVNLVDDTASIVFNCHNQSLDSDIVVIFIDAMGYSPELDEITTLEATRIRNGQVCETFCEFIKSDSDSGQQYRTIAETFPDFQAFIGNAVIASFQNNHFMDTQSFYNALSQKFGFPAHNTYINLTSLANLLFPKLNNKAFPESELGIFFGCSKGYMSEIYAKILLELKAILNKKHIIRLVDIHPLTQNNSDYVKTFLPHKATILVKNQAGLRDLYKILTDSELKYFHEKPLIPMSRLNQQRQNLLIGSSSLEGALQQKLVLRYSLAEVAKFAQHYDYLEIQPLSNNFRLLEPGLCDHIHTLNDLRRINRQIIKLGKMLKKPVVATSDSHFLREDTELYARLRKTHHNDSADCSGMYLRTTEEMLAEFAYLGKKTAHKVVITNTRLVNEMIEYVIPLPQKLSSLVATCDTNISTAIKPGRLTFATNKTTGKSLLCGYDKLEDMHFEIPSNFEITDFTPLHKLPETGEVVTELDYHDLV